MAITVAILDGEIPYFRELKRIVASDQMCSCVCTGQDWKMEWRRISHLGPDVVIMDVQVPDGSGLEGIAKFKRLLPQTQILVISRSEEMILEALRAGASGYLLKSTPREKLLAAIHEIKRGGVPMSGEVARRVLQTLQRSPARLETTESLTGREQEILQLLAEGGPSREIAQRLSISVDTVNSHLKHIYGKLQVRSRTEAVIKYLTHRMSGAERPEISGRDVVGQSGLHARAASLAVVAE
jgi:DNA-binding NarL/FixJ family response regulator